MKVVFITPYVPPNIVQLYELIAQMAKVKNISYSIFCIKRKPIHRTHDIVDYKDLEIKFFDGYGFYLQQSEIALDFPRGIFKSLRKTSPDVIVFDGYGIGYLSPFLYILLAKLFKKRLRLIFWNSNTSVNSGPIASSGNVLAKLSSKIIRIAKRFFLSFFDHFAAGGSSMSEYLIDLGISEEKISLVPRATSSKQKITALNSKSKPNDTEMIRFIYCGEISKRKGVDILLKASSMKRSNSSNSQIDIYGNYKETEKEYFMKLFSESPEVKYHGWIENKNILKELSISDVLIMPSRREPFGRIAIEALSCGLFLIISEDCGASRDVDQDFMSIILKKNSPEELAKSFDYVARNIFEIRSDRGKRIDWTMDRWTHDIAAENMIRILYREKE